MICVGRRTQKNNSEFQMGIEPTTFRTLVRCSNHGATENSVVSTDGFISLLLDYILNFECSKDCKKYRTAFRVRLNY